MSDPGLTLPPSLPFPPGLSMGPPHSGPGGPAGGPHRFDPNSTVGALLIGGLISAILFGVTSTQSWVYYQSDHGDRRMLKAVVAVLWLLDTFDMCLIFHILYWYLITHYGDSTVLANPVWSIIAHVLVTSFTETVVRCMFALRIWRLSHNVLLVVIILAITLTDLVACISKHRHLPVLYDTENNNPPLAVITVKAFSTTFATLNKLDALFYLNFSAGLAGDGLVAISLCWILHQSRTGFGKTETIVTWLMTYIINTGLFTAITASLGLILFAIQPNNFIYIAVYLQLSKLYANAYLAMLNGRTALRSHANSTDPITLDGIQLSSSLSATHVRSGQDSLAALQRMKSLTKGDTLDIVVHTEVDRRSDPKHRSQDLFRKTSV
ncbi:hypothetical protein BC629DRAFT_1587735 [Irpex lacteus]|nr:hypothetical protein BC629DRAFT_1587735 [Irpex lacteus]